MFRQFHVFTKVRRSKHAREAPEASENIAAGSLASLNLKVSEALQRDPAVKFSLVVTGGAVIGCKVENSFFE